jgi:hypothetical protein
MILIGSIQIITVKTLIIEVITNYFKQITVFDYEIQSLFKNHFTNFLT